MDHTSGYLQAEPDPEDKTEMGVYGSRDGKRLGSSGSSKAVEFYEFADGFHLRMPKTDSMRQKVVKLIVDYYRDEAKKALDDYYREEAKKALDKFKSDESSS